jgi:acyl-CoA thioester hydrolase
MTEPDTQTPGTPEPEPSPFEVTLQLRWSDQDLLGHVNNARIVTLMEEARVRWSRRQLAEHESFGGGLVVASLTVDYLRQLDYRPDMTVLVGVVRIGNRSFTVRHMGYQDGELAFDGKTVMVPLAEDRTSSRELTDAERDALREYLLPADG